MITVKNKRSKQITELIGVWRKKKSSAALFVYADENNSFAIKNNIVLKTDEFKEFGGILFRYVFLNKQRYELVKGKKNERKIRKV